MPHTRFRRGLPDDFDFEGTGQDARDWLDRAYGTSLKITGDLGTVRHTRVSHGSFAFDHLLIDAGFAVDSDAMPALVVVDLINGECAYTRDGVTDPTHDGDSVLASGWNMPFRNVSRDGFEVRTTTITSEALAAAVEDLDPGYAWELITFSSYVPHSPSAGARWRAMVDQLSGAVPAIKADDPASAEEAAADAGRLLAHTLLASFPNNVMADAVQAERQDGPPGSSLSLVSHAMRVIEALPYDEVNLDDLADACGVTPRTLQYAFRKHLHCSPLDYLRRVRLDLVRRSLRTGGKTSVSDAAARLGFHNPGRFASDYRQVFDENPRQTLHRSTS